MSSCTGGGSNTFSQAGDPVRYDEIAGAMIAAWEHVRGAYLESARWDALRTLIAGWFDAALKPTACSTSETPMSC